MSARHTHLQDGTWDGNSPERIAELHPNCTACIPAVITKLRALDEGAWDGFMEDFTDAQLQTAIDWAESNDPNLAVLIMDEIEFREDMLQERDELGRV